MRKMIFCYALLSGGLTNVIFFSFAYDFCQLKGIYFVIYGIISEFTDKGQFQHLTNLKGPQEGTYLYTTQFLSLR